MEFAAGWFTHSQPPAAVLEPSASLPWVVSVAPSSAPLSHPLLLPTASREIFPLNVHLCLSPARKPPLASKCMQGKLCFSQVTTQGQVALVPALPSN